MTRTSVNQTTKEMSFSSIFGEDILETMVTDWSEDGHHVSKEGKEMDPTLSNRAI